MDEWSHPAIALHVPAAFNTPHKHNMCIVLQQHKPVTYVSVCVCSVMCVVWSCTACQHQQCSKDACMYVCMYGCKYVCKYVWMYVYMNAHLVGGIELWCHWWNDRPPTLLTYHINYCKCVQPVTMHPCMLITHYTTSHPYITCTHLCDGDFHVLKTLALHHKELRVGRSEIYWSHHMSHDTRELTHANWHGKQ